jgi:hypothetical protein
MLYSVRSMSELQISFGSNLAPLQEVQLSQTQASVAEQPEFRHSHTELSPLGTVLIVGIGTAAILLATWYDHNRNK